MAFVLAVAGASIGFKTIWQFPYLVSQNGGGAFLLVYVVLAFVLGTPLLIAQIMIGRRAHASPIRALSMLGATVPGKRYWGIVGAIIVLSGFVTFSYLSVIAGWAIAYLVRALFGVFAGLTADGVNNIFAVFVKDPEKQVFWHSLFVTSVALITAGGLRGGLAVAVRWLVPALYLMLLVLAAYAVQVGGLADAANFFFGFDFSKVTASAWFSAMAQVFFGLGLGTGVALMYAAYLRADASIPKAAVGIVGLDVITSMVAGVIVLAVLFGGSVAPGAGPSLVFQSLPLAFDHLPYGRWFVCVFFLALVAIALLMGIGLLEPVIVALEERFQWRRRRAVIVSAIAGWALGLVTVFSVSQAAFTYKFLGIEKHLGLFDIMQTATAEFALPLGAFGFAVLAGWLLSPGKARAELDIQSLHGFNAWLWLLRVPVPLMLLTLLFTLYRL